MADRAFRRADQSHATLEMAGFSATFGKWPRVSHPSEAAVMVLRTSNIEGRSQVHVEPPRADELPKGVQGTEQAESTGERHADGTFTRGARTVQSQGGSSLREMTRLARRLALGDSYADPRFEPYARAASAFRRTQVTALARSVGGGHCGPAPSSIIASAALQLAGSRFAFEVLGDMALGSRLADASRQNLLAAHELCAREAAARPRSTKIPPWFIQDPPKTPTKAT